MAYYVSYEGQAVITMSHMSYRWLIRRPYYMPLEDTILLLIVISLHYIHVQP